LRAQGLTAALHAEFNSGHRLTPGGMRRPADRLVRAGPRPRFSGQFFGEAENARPRILKPARRNKLSREIVTKKINNINRNFS
jgi:hypothetical protein